jgi:hypothetical protein
MHVMGPPPLAPTSFPNQLKLGLQITHSQSGEILNHLNHLGAQHLFNIGLTLGPLA